MKEAVAMAYEAPDDGTGPVATVTRLPGAADPEPPAGEETPNLPAIPGVPGSPEVAGPGAPARAVYADISRAPGERLPILPPSLRGRENIRAALALAAGQTWHRSRYHGLRSPLYLVAVLVWAFIGACRLVMRQVHWWWVLEQHGLRSQAAANGDSREWMRLHKEAKATRQVRGLVLLGEVFGLTVAATVAARYAPLWAGLVLAAGAVLFFARAGRPAGHRIVGTAIVPPDYSPPTHEIITRALGSLGIAQINAVLKPDKDGRVQGIRFVSDVMRDGPGWACHLDLPHGVSASDILARREALASGLRRPLSATWPAGVPEEHPGRLDLWVGMHDISKQKAPACPLVKAKATDLFDVIPFGTDPRLRGVKVPMFEMNWIIGASPGQGKTATVRVLNCGAALDPLAVLWIHELAGKGDLHPLAQVCHRYCSGLDDDSIAYAAESARLLKVETEQRSEFFKKLRAQGILPKDGKVTRELAVRYKQLRPLTATFDEVQNLITDKQHGDQAAEDLAYVIRVGRALGIIVILSTQRPAKEMIPTSITGLIVGRFCLMVPDQPANDLVLGTTSYRRGYDATVFRPKLDAGLGWLKGGEDGIPQICRTYYLDLDQTEAIAARAREIRDRAGVLTGYALGEAEVAEKRDVLADVAAVFGADKGLQWEELAERLADRWPGRWADVTADAISAQCRRLGVPSVDVRSGGSVRKGCRKVGVDKATGP
jgi:DNA segregation ATPase FtsK/SpoIIIE, S-DNA-T family